MPKYQATAYIRLSYTDDRSSESDSVTNQRKLIENFIERNPDIQIVSEKIDDGYSGIIFDRPAFKEMMQDITDGKINCVIVKDLSRLGREYIETGRYLRRVFPTYGVRFIAITDNIDTAHEGSGDDLTVTLLWIIGPCHHVNVRMMLLVVEGSAPPKAAGRNFHGRRPFCLMGQQQSAPALAVFVAQPCGILPLQGVDEGPYRTGVCVDLLHGLLQISSTVRREQTVRSGPLRNVLQITTACRGFHQFHTISGGDILGVVSAAASRLDVAGLLNETLHSSILF